jgi:hypothetical protein
MSIRAFFSCLGRMIWRAPRILWVCRVPAISAIGGGLFVASLAQTRDMFADIGLAWWDWALFFLITLGWAWIVHWAGRHVLRLDDWVPEAHVPGGISSERRAELRRSTSARPSRSRDCSGPRCLSSWQSPWCVPIAISVLRRRFRKRIVH